MSNKLTTNYSMSWPAPAKRGPPATRKWPARPECVATFPYQESIWTDLRPSCPSAFSRGDPPAMRFNLTTWRRPFFPLISTEEWGMPEKDPVDGDWHRCSFRWLKVETAWNADSERNSKMIAREKKSCKKFPVIVSARRVKRQTEIEPNRSRRSNTSMLKWSKVIKPQS